MAAMSDKEKKELQIRNSTVATERENVQEQIAMCMEIADSEDVEIYKDHGSGADVYRPELFRMMKDVRNGKIQRVIVRDLARLSRSFPHLTDPNNDMIIIYFKYAE